jgi:outer membrane protein assembly factor BamB
LTIILTLLIQWSFSTAGSIAASCTLGNDGVLYVPSFDKSVYAVQTRGGSAGTALWNYTTGGPVIATPTFCAASSLLTFGSSDGLLYALHTTPSQALNWTFNSAAPLFSSGTVHPHSFTRPLFSASQPRLQVTKSGAVALGSGNKHFYLLDLNQGTVAFEYGHFLKKTIAIYKRDAFHMYETGDSLVASGAVSADGKLLAVGSTDGYIYAFSDA